MTAERPSSHVGRSREATQADSVIHLSSIMASRLSWWASPANSDWRTEYGRSQPSWQRRRHPAGAGAAAAAAQQRSDEEDSDPSEGAGVVG